MKLTRTFYKRVGFVCPKLGFLDFSKKDGKTSEKMLQVYERADREGASSGFF
jgi:hypothetical protein